tara:strand:+ start:29483 stop:32806 length:3324 start_codon:yes stop_codon:yes gene_type:complete
MSLLKRTKYCIAIILLFSTILNSQSLEDNFNNPPDSAKPRTWMHAMSGNMSKEGMTKDLEAIAAAGQGGVLLFDVTHGVPYGEVQYNSNKHHEIITHAAKECERLSLSFGVHNCDGWSSSGGPWITPEQSMKMVVWSETVVAGGKKVDLQLPEPAKFADFYKDIAVIAYPALKTEIMEANVQPVLSSSIDNFNVDELVDGQINKMLLVKDKGSWVQYDFGKPHTIQSVFMFLSLAKRKKLHLEKSDDGKNFTKVSDLEILRITKKHCVIDERFEQSTARYFRVVFDENIRLSELQLRAIRPFDDYVEHTGFGYFTTKDATPFKVPKPEMVIDKNAIINLSSSMNEDGTLSATLPEGKWTIMRFGYTTTDVENSPSSKWGKGLECDKFSREAYKIHWDAFSQKVIDNSKKLAPNALQYLEIDSYEMGGQNWTNGFEDIFRKEKGYDIIPFLPIFAGRYVESSDAVTGVLYDINYMFSSLMTNNYYKYFTELCNENGLLSYVEPYGKALVSTLDVSAYIDIPMTEFWMGRPHNYVPSTVSGAHIYGKNVISAESFTSQPTLNWNIHPAMAKTSGDRGWAGGVNEFMFHRFAHQANTHVKPGMTMGKWGSHIDRTQTWWMNAGKAWFEYIARGSYLLREGYPVADVMVFVGDGSSKGGIRREYLKPTIPNSINYDCTNADVLINRTTIKNNQLVLPEGNAYSYLLLKDIKLIELSTLRRLKAIVDAGIPIIGERPKSLAGYKISAELKKEFDELCDYIWSKPNCKTTFDFSTLKPDFEAKGQDLIFSHRKTADSDIYFFYNEEKKPVSHECLFRVANKIPELWNAETGEITKLANFRSEGEYTRLWIDLKSEESAFIVFREAAGDINSITTVAADKQFYLKDNNAVLVETRSSEAAIIDWSNGKISEIPAIQFPKEIDLSSQWNVEFLKEHNYAANINFDKLTDWKDHENDSIKYYSGTAIYSKSFKVKKKNNHIKYILDLGEVNVVAEVSVNGKNAGVLWKAPFEMDITDYLQNDDNQLEVKITNQWGNRLIGDENYPRHDNHVPLKTNVVGKDLKMPGWYINNQPMPKGARTTFSAWNFHKKGDELMPSGLIGPVKINYKRIIEISNM